MRFPKRRLLCLFAAVFTALSVSSARGIDVGWRPLPQGGFEYLLQLPPQLLPLLRGGEDLFSDVPVELDQATECRIQIGSKLPPRTGKPAARKPVLDAAGNLVMKVPLDHTGWTALEKEGYEYVIRLTEEDLKELDSGRGVSREIPLFSRPLRRVRVTTSTAALPHDAFPTVMPTESAAAPPPVSDAKTTESTMHTAKYPVQTDPVAGAEKDTPKPKETEGVEQSPWSFDRMQTALLAALCVSLVVNAYLFKQFLRNR